MKYKTNWLPEGYAVLTPYLIVDGAAKALEFYKKGLGAEVTLKIDGPNGTIGHAEIKIGGANVMVADQCPEMKHLAPKPGAGVPVSLLLYVPDADKAGAKFTEAGGKVMRPVADQFYGDRSGTYQDPFGHIWTLATHIEDVSPDEMAKRAREMAK